MIAPSTDDKRVNAGSLGPPASCAPISTADETSMTRSGTALPTGGSAPGTPLIIATTNARRRATYPAERALLR
jgi:hypothetical protein